MSTLDGLLVGAGTVTTPDQVDRAVAAAHRHETIVSYDLNDRPSLCTALAVSNVPARSMSGSPSTSMS